MDLGRASEWVCPIVSELMPHRRRAREMAPAGAECIVQTYGPSDNLRTTFKKVIKRAGLTPWPKLTQNLRATRETELIAVYLIKDVGTQIGNSGPIAMKHYAMTMSASLQQAILEGAAGVTEKTPPNPPPALTKSGKKGQSTFSAPSEKPLDLRGFCNRQRSTAIRPDAQGGTRTLRGFAPGFTGKRHRRRTAR